MIEITPNILTKDESVFRELFARYRSNSSLDIDIIKEDFVPNPTVSLSKAMEFIAETDQILGFHLMVNSPEIETQMLLDSFFNQKMVSIYSQQEVDLKSYLNLKFPGNWRKSVCVQIESPLKDLEFYNQFNEVQFMSIQIGYQRTPFDIRVLDKVDTLREMGYNGKISLDGGVNLESSALIKQHSVDRVSVGSYFVKNENFLEAFQSMNNALNTI